MIYNRIVDPLPIWPLRNFGWPLKRPFTNDVNEKRGRGFNQIDEKRWHWRRGGAGWWWRHHIKTIYCTILVYFLFMFLSIIKVLLIFCLKYQIWRQSMYVLTIFVLIFKTLFERIKWHYFVTGDIGGRTSTALEKNGDKGGEGLKMFSFAVTSFLNGP